MSGIETRLNELEADIESVEARARKSRVFTFGKTMSDVEVALMMLQGDEELLRLAIEMVQRGDDGDITQEKLEERLRNVEESRLRLARARQEQEDSDSDSV